MRKNRVRITLQMPREQWAELKTLAELYRIDVSKLARHLITLGLEYKKECGMVDLLDPLPGETLKQRVIRSIESFPHDKAERFKHSIWPDSIERSLSMIQELGTDEMDMALPAPSMPVLPGETPGDITSLNDSPQADEVRWYAVIRDLYKKHHPYKPTPKEIMEAVGLPSPDECYRLAREGVEPWCNSSSLKGMSLGEWVVSRVMLVSDKVEEGRDRNLQ